MTTRTVAADGTITLGDLTVRRLDFGAMRIRGQGVWGEPDDRDETLRSANEHRIPGHPTWESEDCVVMRSSADGTNLGSA